MHYEQCTRTRQKRNMTTEEKHATVHSWLQSVFAGEEVPPYEVNSATVDCLYKMAVECEESERQNQVLLKDLQQQTREYESKTTRLRGVSEYVGVSTSDLSPTSTVCIRSLSEAALTLNVADTSDTSFCLALTRLCGDSEDTKSDKDEWVRKMAAHKEQLKTIVLQQASQHKVLSQLSSEVREKQAITEKLKKDIVFLRQKSDQYQKQVSTIKTELERVGYDHGVSHSALLDIAGEVKDLQEQLAPLRAQLASYKDLPPDIDLARVKVEEARTKLLSLETELSERIDLVHVEK